MKPILILTFILSFHVARAGDTGKSHETKPNPSAHPFPTALPVVAEGKPEDFDWKRYIAESISNGDKVFRLHEAYKHDYIAEEGAGVWGVQMSASDDAARNKIAADEVSRACDLLEAMYRNRLKDDADLLATLNEFITHHRKAMEASVKLVGGSWDGGSGARVAYPAARCDALLHYRAALLGLGSSLHFQDMPDIDYPQPSTLDK